MRRNIGMRLAVAACVALIVVAIVLIRNEASSITGTVTVLGNTGSPACKPTDDTYSVSLRPTNGSGETLEAPLTPLEIVSSDPCVLRGSFTLRVDPSANYDACVDQLSPPGGMDQVGIGWCGYAVPTGILQDGRLDLTIGGSAS
jgi:hypothetical protein